MFKVKLFVLSAALAVAMATGAAPARGETMDTQGAVDSLLQLIPSDWPFVMRVDCSDANASGAFLKSLEQGPHAEQMKQWNTSYNIGLAKLLAAIGLELDTDKGVLPWAGERMVMGMDPRALMQSAMKGGPSVEQIPGMVLAVSCKDRALAERSLLDMVGSVIRDSDPVTQQTSGATVYVWKMQAGKTKLQPAYAVGDDFVMFADSAERIQEALKSSADHQMPRSAKMLAAHSDDIVAFAMDLSSVVQQMMPKGDAKGGGEDMLSAMMLGMAASQAGFHGGVNMSAKGMVLTVQGDVPPMMMGFIAPMLGGEPSTADVAQSLPSNVMAVVSVGTPSALSPMVSGLAEGKGGMPESRPDLPAALQMLTVAKEGTVGLALTGIIPRPNYLLVCQSEDGAKAAAMLREFRTALGKQGVRVAASPQSTEALIYHLVGGKQGETVGYTGQAGNAVFFASVSVTPSTCLAANPAFADVRALAGGSRTADIWLSLEAVSALGYLYDSMGASELLVSRWLADSLKETRWFGVSAGLTAAGAEMKLALRTGMYPSAPGMAAYMGGMMGFAAAMAAGTTRSFPVPGSSVSVAHGAQSLSNLKQLSLALLMFADDHDGKLPAAKTWKADLRPYVKDPDVFESPFGDAFVYEYNPALSGKKLSAIANPAAVPAFVEAKPGMWPTPGNYSSPDGKIRVAFVQARAKTCSEARSEAGAQTAAEEEVARGSGGAHP